MKLDFNHLLTKTKEQPEPQRLLMLFANAQVEKSTNENMNGSITPVMCVDKLPEELNSFSDLIEEADGISKDWNFIFFASLAGDKGQAPTTEEADPYLNKMTNDVASGADLSRYVVFDRNENPIEMMV